MLTRQAAETVNKPMRQPASYADIEALPANIVGELIDGALVTHPRPAPRHAVAAFSLGGKLNSPFQDGTGGPGGWIFMVEPELHFGSDVVVPDLAAWRRETLPELPDTAWLETRPDWLCEVISPSTARYDRGPKRGIYARAGVPYLWLPDPVERLLEAFALTEDGWLLLATIEDGGAVSVLPFEAISFSLGLLWPFDAPGGSAAPSET